MRTLPTTLHSRAWSIALFVMLCVIGCSDADINDNTTEPANPQTVGELDTTQAGLVAIQSCGELESYIKQLVLSEFELFFQAADVPGWMGDTAPVLDSSDLGSSPDGSGEQVGSSSGEKLGTPDYSGTNNQVASVDEADLVKTDGNYIYTVAGNRLRILRALPAADAEEVSSVELPGAPRELFLSGQRLLAYSTTYGGVPVGGSIDKDINEPVMPEVTPAIDTDDAGSDASSGSSGSAESMGSEGALPTEPAPAQKPGAEQIELLRGAVTILTSIDISIPESPVVERTVSFEGQYASARLIDGRAHTVLRSRLFVPSVSTMPIYSMPVDGGVISSGGAAIDDTMAIDDGNAEPTEPAEDMTPPEPVSAPEEADENVDPWNDAIAALEAELDASSLSDWMPQVLDTIESTTTQYSLADCSAFYKPSIQQGLELIAVVTLDLTSQNADISSTVTIGQSESIYANAEALYIASHTYGYWFWNGAAAIAESGESADFSVIHKFSLAGDTVTYSASGKVPGRILNQFSMDEHEGNFRVATTSGFGDNSDNGVYVMNTTEEALEIVGATTDLAAGEEIYSARFIGDKGYVVTFRQVDPLFTLDLSDPTAPAVVGELKIPGFSTYIHPLGENYLLTIGRDALDQGTWVEIQGIQLQIFDVSNPAEPTVAFKETFASAGATSEALYDHRAFAWFPEKGILAVPFSQYGNDTDDGAIDIGMPEDPVMEEEAPEEAPQDSTEPVEDEDTSDEASEEDMDWGKPEFSSGVKVFAVSTDSGFSELGEIDFTTLTPDSPWRATVDRIVRIEDHLYSIGDAGMLVSALSDLSEVAQVVFEAFAGDDDLDDVVPVSQGDTPEPAPAPEDA